MTHRSRVGLLVVVVLLVSAGCLTRDPTVGLNTTDSSVFAGASAGGSWATGQVRATVNVTPNATTNDGVSQLNVVVGGKTFHRAALDSGQSSATVVFPTNGTATLVAVNTINGTVVETRNATISGDSVV